MTINAVRQEIVDAVDRFARAWGSGRRPSWRTMLHDAWERGGYYPDWVPDADKGLLQAARNTLGPSWLARHKPDWRKR